MLKIKNKLPEIIETSTPVLEYKPNFKTKMLGFLIPMVIVIGLAMIAVDRMGVANAKEQNAWKAGALLILYCIYSLRGLYTYRLFLSLTPDEVKWTQGFPPFKKSLIFKYKDIQKMEITTLTSALVFTLSSGLKLKLSPSVMRTEGQLANVLPPSDSKIKDDPVGTMYPAVREIFFLKNEIQKRVDASV